MATGLTFEQVRAMGGSSTGGLTLSQIKSAQTPTESKPGFFSSLITDPLKTLVIKPGIRFGQAIGSVIAPMLGATPEGIERASEASTIFGGMEIEPQKAFGEGGARQITGDIAKTASYLYTGGQASTLAGQTLRGQILRGGLTGLKIGAVSGGAYSFGEAIQNAENQPAAVAYQTLFGTALGGVTGGILGATLPAISAGLGKIKEYRNFDTLTEKLNQRNREILKPTSSQMAKWEQSKVDPIKTFSREFGLESVPTANNTLQLDDFIGQTDTRYKAGSEGFNTILRNSPEVVSISQREARALSAIESSSLTPSQKLTAKAKVQSEFIALKAEAQKAGQLLGEDNIPVAYADNLKDRFWQATKYFGPEEASVSNEVNRNIGHSFKEGIEEVITDVNVRNYNKQLQELIYLRDFLESKNGKVPGTGGKMLRYTLRTVGAISGTAGGPVGSVAGAITADQVAQAIASPTARTWLIRRQLAKLPPEVRKSLEQEAKQILENMAVKRAETLRLPPPSNASLVNQGRPIPVVPEDVEFTGGDVAAQSKSFSEITPPATTATTIKNSANNIDESVSPIEPYVKSEDLPVIQMGNKTIKKDTSNLPKIAFAGLALPLTIDPKNPDVMSVEKIKNEVAFRESGVSKEPYKTIGITGDLGKYQVNPTTLKSYSNKFLGKEVGPKEFLASPALQEEFIQNTIKHLSKLGAKSLDAFLILWHKGWGDVSSKRIQELKKDPAIQKYLNNQRKK